MMPTTHLSWLMLLFLDIVFRYWILCYNGVYSTSLLVNVIESYYVIVQGHRLIYQEDREDTAPLISCLYFMLIFYSVFIF